ncbi:hypothetical protein [Nocardia testacea]|uniref:hypothetical protein n=1 Tax=Nocardia testacea TaxID=248551 RepID=UPI0033E6674C
MSEHDAVNTAGATSARSAGWPELTSSTKQIEWATTVRANKFREMEAGAPAEVDWYREVMLRETSAGVWIDSRNHPWQAQFLGYVTDEKLESLKAKAAHGDAE